MKTAVFCLLVLLICLPASAQQSHINRVDLFSGYSYLHTPTIGLSQQGFNGTFGINVRRWLALGADSSYFSGNTDITLRQTKLVNSPLAGMLPASLITYGVPMDANTFTFAAGPQINIRKWDKMTLFIRPGLGMIRENVELKLAGTPFETLGPALSSMGLKTKLKDTVPFYGVGGGVDLSVSRHLGVRISLDYVHASMFSSLLPSQNNLRISFGPQFKFGEMRQAPR